MVKRTRYGEWKDSYEHYKFELSPEGILLMQCHTEGGPLQWYWESHDRMADAFADIAGDRDEIKCVIHTGTGDTYNALWGKPVTESGAPLYNAYDDAEGVAIMDEKSWFGRMIIENLLAINVPVVAAVNGPAPCTPRCRCSWTSCWRPTTPTSRICRTSPEAWCQVTASTSFGTLWSGPSRSRYFLFMGYKLTAQEAREWGVVHEVLPRDQLLDRAWEIAREIAKRPPIVNRNTEVRADPEPQAGLPGRTPSRPSGRDVGPAPVLPLRCGHAGPGPPVGPEAVVRLITSSRTDRVR